MTRLVCKYAFAKYHAAFLMADFFIFFDILIKVIPFGSILFIGSLLSSLLILCNHIHHDYKVSH